MNKSAVLLLSVILFSSCAFAINEEKIKGNGKQITRETALESFQSIDISAPLKVEVVVGNEYHIQLKGDENLIDLLSIEVKDSKLVVKTTRNNIVFEKVTAVINTPSDIKSFSLSGVADVTLLVPTNTTSFDVSISGVGRVIHHTVETNELNAKLSGVGNIELKGNTKKVVISNSGVGLVDCENLIAQTAECKNSGVGQIKVNATESLTAKVSGIGNIEYGGNPTNVVKSNSGLGKVTKKE